MDGLENDFWAERHLRKEGKAGHNIVIPKLKCVLNPLLLPIDLLCLRVGGIETTHEMRCAQGRHPYFRDSH